MWSRKFLSTPSARRATRTGIRLPRSMGNFYPRPPRGGRPDTNDSRLGPEHFYPRPPRGGRHKHLERRLRASKFLSTPSARRATGLIPISRVCPVFLSTPSARRATLVQPSAQPRVHISIHALREEGDLNPPTQEKRPTNFYPRPPRGGRPSAG